MPEAFGSLLEVLRKEHGSDPRTPTGITALAPHAAYHSGAVRQMVAAYSRLHNY